jgi:hypothetical protein
MAFTKVDETRNRDSVLRSLTETGTVTGTGVHVPPFRNWSFSLKNFAEANMKKIMQMYISMSRQTAMLERPPSIVYVAGVVK